MPGNPLAACTPWPSVGMNKPLGNSCRALVPSSSPDEMGDSLALPGTGSESRSVPVLRSLYAGSAAPNHLVRPNPLASAGTSVPVRDSILETSLPCPTFNTPIPPVWVHYLDRLLYEEGTNSRFTIPSRIADIH